MSAADIDDSLNLSSFSSLFLEFISRLLAQQPKKEGDVVVGVHASQLSLAVLSTSHKADVYIPCNFILRVHLDSVAQII